MSPSKQKACLESLQARLRERSIHSTLVVTDGWPLLVGDAYVRGVIVTVERECYVFREPHGVPVRVPVSQPARAAQAIIDRMPGLRAGVDLRDE